MCGVWCSEEKNTTDTKKAHFLTLKNGVRGVLIENTTEIQKFRGVSKSKLSDHSYLIDYH